MSSSTLSAASSRAPSLFYMFTWTKTETSPGYTHKIRLYQKNSNGTHHFWQINPDLPATKKVSAFYLARYLDWTGSLDLLQIEQSLDQKSLISTVKSIYPSYTLTEANIFEMIDGIRALQTECQLHEVYDSLLSNFYLSAKQSNNNRFLQKFCDLLNNTPETYWVASRKECPYLNRQLHLRAPIIPSSSKTMIDNSQAHLSDQSLVQKPAIEQKTALKKRKEPKKFTFELRHLINFDPLWAAAAKRISEEAAPEERITEVVLEERIRHVLLKERLREFAPQPGPALDPTLETEEQRAVLGKYQEKPCLTNHNKETVPHE